MFVTFSLKLKKLIVANRFENSHIQWVQVELNSSLIINTFSFGGMTTIQILVLDL